MLHNVVCSSCCRLENCHVPVTPVYPTDLHSPTAPLPSALHPKEGLLHYVSSSQETPVKSSGIQYTTHYALQHPSLPHEWHGGISGCPKHAAALQDPAGPHCSVGLQCPLCRIPLYHRMQQCQQTLSLCSSIPHSSHPAGCPGGDFFHQQVIWQGLRLCLLQQQSQVFWGLVLRTPAAEVVSPPSRCCIVAEEEQPLESRC